MPSSIKNIVDRFPFPTINPIVGTPNYESIADIHLKLNSNTALVQSNLGCGMLGLLFLTVLPDVYAKLSNIASVLPVNPGPKPNIPDDATGAAIADLQYHHAESTTAFILSPPSAFSAPPTPKMHASDETKLTKDRKWANLLATSVCSGAALKT